MMDINLLKQSSVGKIKVSKSPLKIRKDRVTEFEHN